ncbi:MAG TPA: CRTAC1 family protein [Candidatus Polarisedimenticolia bacterium]|nr:CRTAC1 family protein [Candidatus Polarisedimenticolia bacterium]
MPPTLNAFGLRLSAPALVGAGVLVVALLAAAAWKFAAPRPVPMPERLRAIAAATDPETNMFQNGDRAKALEARWTREGEAAGPGVLMGLARELLNAGRTEEAIRRFDELETQTRRRGVVPGSGPWIELRVQQAIAQLRRAEVENCAAMHNPRSCLFPIEGAGVHGRTRGSEAAMTLLTDVLNASPDHQQARWLLNIAAMTLGVWPDGVPERWRLGPELFASEHDIGRFPDIAGRLGLDVDDHAGGSIVDDLDGDGDYDIMASAMGPASPLRFFVNQGDGTFVERTKEAGLDGENGALNIIQGDYDNDGRIDVLMLRGGWMGRAGRLPVSLLHNDGGGRFTDVTEEAGLLRFHPTQTAVWFDYDGDGWLDLFIGNEARQDDPHPCELFHSNRDGTFTEVAAQAGVAAVGFVKGVTSGDFNNDGRPDLYLSVRGAENILYRNDGASGGGWRFTDVAAEAGVTEPFVSFPTWFFDYDNDGWEDLFVSGYLIRNAGDLAADALGLATEAERPRLYRNNGDGTFADVTRAAHLHRVLQSMGSNYGDLDNDGWLDIYLGTGDPELGTLIPDRVFRNAEGRRFQDVTTSGGFGHLQKGHGVSFADLDNDGDQDVYHVVGGAFEADTFRNALFENPGHGNRFLALQLEGVKANRGAIGARLRVVVTTAAGERSLHRTVRSGGSFGCSPLRQEIGLGDATGVARVEIRWPGSDGLEVLTGLEPDRRYLIRQGESAARPLSLAPVRLGGKERS